MGAALCCSAIRIDIAHASRRLLKVRIGPEHFRIVVHIPLPDGNQFVAYEVVVIRIEVVQRPGICGCDHGCPTACGIKERITPAFASMQRNITIASIHERPHLVFGPEFIDEFNTCG